MKGVKLITVLLKMNFLARLLGVTEVNNQRNKSIPSVKVCKCRRVLKMLMITLCNIQRMAEKKIPRLP